MTRFYRTALSCLAKNCTFSLLHTTYFLHTSFLILYRLPVCRLPIVIYRYFLLFLFYFLTLHGNTLFSIL